VPPERDIILGMRLDLSPDELLTTTRAVRRRLDLARPVEREVLLECLELALQAPSGSNSQGWHWVFVTDPAKRQALADIYRKVFAVAYAPGVQPERDEAGTRVWESAAYLAEHMHEVPVLMVPCHTGRPPSRGNQAGYWGSLLPATWSFCLAARSRGLGTAWTSMHLVHEQEAADVLGIPYEKVAQGGLLPVAYTKGTDFKPGPRKPTTDIVHWDNW
jgi:nitroreductase